MTRTKPSKPSAITPDPSLPYVAWRRLDGRRWMPVAGGTSNSDCWLKMAELMDSMPNGTHADWLILERGREP